MPYWVALAACPPVGHPVYPKTLAGKLPVPPNKMDVLRRLRRRGDLPGFAERSPCPFQPHAGGHVGPKLNRHSITSYLPGPPLKNAPPNMSLRGVRDEATSLTIVPASSRRGRTRSTGHAPFFRLYSIAEIASQAAKKQAVLASVVNRLQHRVPGMDRKAGTVHALGDSLGTVPVLLRKIRYVGRFLIPGPTPRRSWLAMTRCSLYRSATAGEMLGSQ